MYLIYCTERGWWWKAGRNGYTPFVSAAGLWTPGQAREIIEQAAIGWEPDSDPEPPDYPVPLAWLHPDGSEISVRQPTVAELAFAAGYWRAALLRARTSEGLYATNPDVWDQYATVKALSPALDVPRPAAGPPSTLTVINPW